MSIKPSTTWLLLELHWTFISDPLTHHLSSDCLLRSDQMILKGPYPELLSFFHKLKMKLSTDLCLKQRYCKRSLLLKPNSIQTEWTVQNSLTSFQSAVIANRSLLCLVSQRNYYRVRYIIWATDKALMIVGVQTWDLIFWFLIKLYFYFKKMTFLIFENHALQEGL